MDTDSRGEGEEDGKRKSEMNKKKMKGKEILQKGKVNEIPVARFTCRIVPVSLVRTFLI